MTTVPYYVYDLLQGNGYRWNYGSISGSGNPDGTPTTITYAFQTSGTTPIGDTVAALSPSQQAAVQFAFGYIEQLCNVTFVQASSVGSAELTLGFDESDTGASSEAGITYWNTESLGGPFVLTQANIYLDNVATNQDLTPGFLTTAAVADGTAESGFGWLTLLHEIGHALGLKHPFDENAANDPNSVLDTTDPSEDTHLYSVMSYTEGPDSGYLNVSAQSAVINNLEPLGYGMFDIAALQYLYGANTSPSLAVLQSIFGADGDTVTGAPGAFTYTFTPNTAAFETIADGGTQDTLNVASFTQACTIDLTQGSFSSLGVNVNVDPGEFLFPDPPSPFAPDDGTDALAIAFGTTVTTCIGGSGNDTIIGNSANDAFEGGAGNNVITGGSGVNKALYAGLRSSYSISFSNGTVLVVGASDDDTLTNIQYLSFSNETIKTPYRAESFEGNNTSDILLRNTAGALTEFQMNGSVIAASTSLGSVSTAWSVVGFGDFNGDGKTDILWRNANGDVVEWLMNGATVASTNDLGVVGTAWTIAGIGDFNGNGKADILWRNANGDVVEWLMNGATVSASADLGIVGTAWDIAGIGDFTGDGMSDILWQNSATGALVEFQMNGATVVATPSLMTIGTNASVIAVGDFNGDGKSDILWQDANGTVVDSLIDGASVTSSTDLGTMGSEWSVAEIGDFTGNGNSDILWRNSTTGALDMWLMSGTSIATDASLAPGAGAGLTVVGGPTPATVAPFANPFADFNGDGTSDILWRNAVNGDTVVFLMSAGSVASTMDLGPIGSAWSVAAIGDFNGDGSADLLWRNGTTNDDVVFTMSGGSVASTTDIGGVGSAWSVVGVGDFNGNGTSDLLWRNATTGDDVIFSMEASSVASTADLGVVGTAWSVVGVGDFNGEGKSDLLWRNATTGDDVIFDMVGSSVASTTDLGALMTGTVWSVAGIGDFNGDGTSDILWRNEASGDTVLWLMNGNSIASSTDLGAVGTAWSVAEVGDFDGDGKADILWRNGTTGANVEFLMNGASVVSTPSLGAVSTTWSVQNPPLATA